MNKDNHGSARKKQIFLFLTIFNPACGGTGHRLRVNGRIPLRGTKLLFFVKIEGVRRGSSIRPGGLPVRSIGFLTVRTENLKFFQQPA
jgi:hypothetical protein